MKKGGFHIIFWLFISIYVIDYLIDSLSLQKSILYTGFEVTTYMVEFYINLFILLPYFFKQKYKITYVSLLLIVLLLMCGSYFLFDLDAELLSPKPQRAILSFFLNHTLFIVISYFVWEYNNYVVAQKNTLLLKNEKLQTEMILLKSQLSPHFLFNSLNNIYSLVLLKHDDAPKMISTLSDILRYLIYERSNDFVSINSEIDIIEKYLKIQKFRQIPGIQNVKFKVNGQTDGIKIPPYVLLTLTENAFKHGDVLELKDGFVTINLSIDNSKIDFRISNSYIKRSSKEGIGLKNIASQLDIIYSKHYDLTIEDDNSIYTLNLKLDGKPS